MSEGRKGKIFTMDPLMNKLLDCNVYYGHQSSKWHPKMKPYLLSKRKHVHIINPEKTLEQLEKAGRFLAEVVSKGEKILLVGCKRPAQEIIRKFGEETNQYYVNHRWLGGTLTNMKTIRKSIRRLEYLENIKKSSEFKEMSKKELASLERERNKLHRHLHGIREMESPPAALFVVDAARESIAIQEGIRCKIPVVAIVDTNADPSRITYPIPANDDSINSINFIVEFLRGKLAV